MFKFVHESGKGFVEYTGILAKRRPTSSDFVTLLPGDSIVSRIDLSKGYAFPLDGKYRIAVSALARTFLGSVDVNTIHEDDLATFNLTKMISRPITVSLEKNPIAEWGAPGNDTLGGPSPKTNCNTTRANQIRTSGSNAVSATLQGYNYLNRASCSASQTYYIEWFGACDTTRYNRVKSNLNAVYNGLQATYPVDCAGSSCTSNTYAYVYPADTTHTVYVCAVFWQVTERNCVLDSQPGTLIHEMSHFNNVAATDDVTYGIVNCRNLAKSNPAAAITKADNYCFYTDSCPAL